MRVEVVFRVEARDDLHAVLRDRTPTAEDAAGLGYVYVDEMIRQFQTTSGFPNGTVIPRGKRINLYWWPFADGLWVRFTLTDSPLGPSGGVRRTVTVVGVDARLPP